MEDETQADLLDAIPWPAMAVTLVASWLVGSTPARRRSAGFWLAAMNVRGILKARASALAAHDRASAGPPG